MTFKFKPIQAPRPGTDPQTWMNQVCERLNAMLDAQGQLALPSDGGGAASDTAGDYTNVPPLDGGGAS